MTTVRYSVAHGRPLTSQRRQGHTVTWCAWWRAEPIIIPLTPPDASGGARARADVRGVVQHHADRFGVIAAELVELPARWCQAFRRTQQPPPISAEERSRRAAANVAGFWRWAGIDGPALSPPEWATMLGLNWPTFTSEELAQAWKSRARDAHPDRGGSHEAFVALERARAAARAHLGAT